MLDEMDLGVFHDGPLDHIFSRAGVVESCFPRHEQAYTVAPRWCFCAPSARTMGLTRVESFFRNLKAITTITQASIGVDWQSRIW